MANNKNNHKKNSNNNINKKSNRKKHNVNRKKKTSAKARKARRTKAIIIGAIVAISIIALIVLLFIYKRKSEESGIQAIGNDATDVNVLLKNGDNKTWESISIACDNGMTWSEDNQAHTASNGEFITFSNQRSEGTVIEISSIGDNGRFTLKGSEVKGDNYPGKIQLHYTSYGLEVTNYVPLEEYIKGVICSEMPESYGLEALKAQAVCARSYLLGRSGRYAYEESLADVDDSVSFQVYGKKWAGGDALAAVNDTAGMVATTKDGQVANTMFYSTSCGYSQTQKADTNPYLARKYISLSNDDPLKNRGVSAEDAIVDTNDDFEDAFAQYIRNVDENALEKDEEYFRWDAELNIKANESKMKEVIVNTYSPSNNKIELDKRMSTKVGSNGLNASSFGGFRSMKVLKRSTGGAIVSLSMEFENGCVIINDELVIRRVLGQAATKVRLNNGSSKSITSLYSSAFTMIPNENGYHIYGGGYGHGCGMSQDGAKYLAKEGKNYVEIIQFFFKDCEVNRIM